MIRRFIILLTLVTLPIAAVLAGDIAKLTDLRPQPFQILFTSTWETAGGHVGTTDTFVIDEDKTAVLEYVTCRVRHRPPNPSFRMTFQLTAEVDEGSAAEVTILDGELEDFPSLTPDLAFYQVSSHSIFACIGTMCDSHGDGDYISLSLHAYRDVPDANAEQMDCLITGYVY